MTDAKTFPKPATDAVIESKSDDRSPSKAVRTAFVAFSQKGAYVGAASIIAGLIGWQIVSDYVIANKLFLASPTQVVASMIELFRSGDIWPHLRASAAEFVLGYSIACVLGIAVGLLIATSPFWKRVLQPWISGMYATPTVALGPLFILWAGIGIWSKVMVIILLVIFAVIINTEAGIRSTSERYLEMMRSFGATRPQLFLKVSLPSATPFILAGLKLGIGRGLIGVVVAELFGSRAGIGRLVGASADTFNMPQLFAAVAILSITGITMTAAFSKLEARLVPWTKD